MIGLWLSLPAFGILFTLALAFAATGYAMHRASFSAARGPRLSGFAGIAPPFLSIPTVLFGLIAGFLASDVWDHGRQASRAVLDERDGAMAIESLSEALPVHQHDLQALVHAYVRAVLDEEWNSDDERGSPKVRAALQAMQREIARPAVAEEAGSSVESALLAAVTRIATARSTRLALRNTEEDGIKWITVLTLAVLAQLGVAVVHLERPRAQIGALAVYTASAVVVLTLIAASEHPYEGSNQISNAPLRAVLPP